MSAGGVQSYLEDLLFRIPHLQQLHVTDKDGVELLKAASDTMADASHHAGFSSLFSTSSEQASKLGLGSNVFIVSRYASHVIVQVNLSPLIVTAVSDPKVNLGLVINAIPELKLRLEPTRSSVQMTINTDKDRDRDRGG